MIIAAAVFGAMVIGFAIGVYAAGLPDEELVTLNDLAEEVAKLQEELAGTQADYMALIERVYHLENQDQDMNY